MSSIRFFPLIKEYYEYSNKETLTPEIDGLCNPSSVENEKKNSFTLTFECKGLMNPEYFKDKEIYLSPFLGY